MFQYRMTGEQVKKLPVKKLSVLLGVEKKKMIKQGQVLERLILEAAPHMDDGWKERACRALGRLFL